MRVRLFYAINANRLFSQNLIYLCKDKPKSAKEISEALCVPMAFVEEELAIQCHGSNGEYGMLRKLENGKYVSNIIIADYDEVTQAAGIYVKHLPECLTIIKSAIQQNREKILSFPYLSEQKDISFILWNLVQNMAWNINNHVQKALREKHFNGVNFSKRPYTQTATAYTQEQWESVGEREGYGCDGIHAHEIGGYREIRFSNIYGPDMERRFDCGHNISTDKIMLLTINAIGGIHVDTLNENQREIAAKAIEAGYIRKNGNMLIPNIVAFNSENHDDFYAFANLGDEISDITDKIAKELSEFIKAHLPEHLMGDCLFYSSLVASFRAEAAIIQACVKEGILCDPKTLGAGIELIVTK